MIAKMNKVSLVIMDSTKNASIEELKKLGVLHIEGETESTKELEQLVNKKAKLERAINILPQNKNIENLKDIDLERYIEIAERIIDLSDANKSASEKIEKLKLKKEELEDWGDFNSSDFDFLKEKGINVSLYETSTINYDSIEDKSQVFVVKRNKKQIKFIWVNPSENNNFEALPLPEMGISKIEKTIEEEQSKIKRINKELVDIESNSCALHKAFTKMEEEIEFETVKEGFKLEEEILSYIKGFLPEKKVPDLKKAAQKNGWALLIDDPTEEDHVPTLLSNNPIVRIINPVFQLLGTIPGYKENDISQFFLLFFSLFFAMIVGDAGYGFIFLLVTLLSGIGTLRKGKGFPDGLRLLLLLSSTTIIWGAITGTWFGSITIAQHPYFSWMVIEKLNSFNPQSAFVIKYLCFIIGVVHIVIAHLWNFINEIKAKAFVKSIAQIGWLSMVLGLYFIVLNLVLDSERFPIPDFSVLMVIAGFGIVICFSEQEGKFFKGILKGIAGFIPTTLDSIAAFSDIISYIRLFAVGLATVEVAKSFNAMAAGLGNTMMGIAGGILIVILGHALNLAMGALSVVVHGVRLNLLEFSGHLSMEWSGIAYKPFEYKD